MIKVSLKKGKSNDFLINVSFGYVWGKINTQPDLIPYAKVNFKSTVDLNCDKIIKVPEESTENYSMISLLRSIEYELFI